MAQTCSLRSLTTFRIGGTPARYFRPSGYEEVAAALEECRHAGLPWRALGGGSNLLVDEGPLPFAVIHICRPGFADIERMGKAGVRVGAGTLTSDLLTWCAQEGLGGLEFLAGVPGTVGGALCGNAGAWGCAIGDVMARVQVVRPDGQAAWVSRADVRCAYRHAELGGVIVTAADLELEPCHPALVRRRISERTLARATRHPVGLPSAGCIFKNPAAQSAGALLDLCGLKGRRAGDAEVSRRHANFILNRGGAQASDVLLLIEVMRQAVRRRFDIQLDLEVKHWTASAPAA